MKQRKQHTFDAPIDRVWAMFHTPASHVAKFSRMGHQNIRIQEEDVTADALRLVIARDVTLELPGFAKKVLSPTNHVISTDVWRDNGDGTYGGEFTLKTVGAPIDISGTTHIEPEGDDKTRYDLVVDVNATVPLIGRKLTSWAEGDVKKQMDEEFAAGDAWLADER